MGLEAAILIVGAGPVGIFLALKLAQHGVKAVVIDRQHARYPLPRAVTFDHESYRLFNSLGLGAELEQVVEQIVYGQGGEDGQNFVWRDAQLKRE